GYRFLRDGTAMKQINNNWRRVIVRGETEELIREIHEAGHLGARATIKKIQERYWWPGLVEEVQKFTSSCDPCQREKKPKKAMDIYPMVASRPFQIIGIDHVGPLHKTKKGNQYIIVAQDYFTKCRLPSLHKRLIRMKRSTLCKTISSQSMVCQSKSS